VVFALVWTGGGVIVVGAAPHVPEQGSAVPQLRSVFGDSGPDTPNRGLAHGVLEPTPCWLLTSVSWAEQQGLPAPARLMMAAWFERHALLAFRGPGFYLSLLKLVACWMLFALWVWTCDWASRDCQLVKLNYAVWNPILVFPFFVALLILLSPLGILFVIGYTLMALAYVAPLIAYVYVRNGVVEPHARVLTPDHLRHLLTGKEKAAPHEKGAPVELEAQGGATERDNSVNLFNARQSPGLMLVKNLVADLVQERGDAVMFEFTPEAVGVRYRVDGIWHNTEPQDRESGDAMLEVLKMLSALDKNERRKRQSGTFGAKYSDLKFSCRFMSQGTETGERVVVQLNELRRKFHTFEELGMRDKLREAMHEVMGNDSGFVLVSTLPSDGLTTTTDVTLLETDRLLRGFVAIEDEAKRETEIENVEVTTFKRSAGETPATVLPKLVRTYPDVIVIRNLADVETVKILCDQVGENRLIVGTLHAKDSCDALLRVLNLKVPPRDFAPVLSAVLYSRLVRKLCATCRIAYPPSAELLKKLRIPEGRVPSFYREPNPQEVEKECQACGGIGYLGRTGIFELLIADEPFRQALLAQPNRENLRKAARACGMRSLQDEGILLVAKGVTSLQELQRVLKHS
jgi:type II secretory ATPase GspE/PulE/Tfp pilus assembly ATPase PilB-like protein